MDIQNIGIIGAGPIGTTVARLAASGGLRVILVEVEKEILEKAAAGIREVTENLVKQGRIPANEVDSVMGRIQLSMDLKAMASMDLVLETVADDESLKLDLFRQLGQTVGQGVILATGTDLLSVTKIAAVTQNPPRVIGLHFAGVPPELRVAEVIRGVQTSPDTAARVEAMLARMNVARALVHDFPGFVANRVTAVMINEAVNTLYEGIASAEEIDHTVAGATGQALGPLTLADCLGLDRVVSILKSLYSATGNPRFAPSPLLVKYVEAGYLGKKSGRGFFTY